MWPVMAGIKWLRTYHAMSRRPSASASSCSGRWAGRPSGFSLRDHLHDRRGHRRGVISPLAVLAPFAALLVGLAFNGAVAAFSASLEGGDDGGSRGQPLRLIPMFLFSGTFFPVSQLPDWLSRSLGDAALERRRALPDAHDGRRGRAPRRRARRVPVRVRRSSASYRRDPGRTEGRCSSDRLRDRRAQSPRGSLSAQDRSFRLVYRDLRAARRTGSSLSPASSSRSSTCRPRRRRWDARRRHHVSGQHDLVPGVRRARRSSRPRR